MGESTVEKNERKQSPVLQKNNPVSIPRAKLFNDGFETSLKILADKFPSSYLPLFAYMVEAIGRKSFDIPAPDEILSRRFLMVVAGIHYADKNKNFFPDVRRYWVFAKPPPGIVKMSPPAIEEITVRQAKNESWDNVWIFIKILKAIPSIYYVSMLKNFPVIYVIAEMDYPPGHISVKFEELCVEYRNMLEKGMFVALAPFPNTNH